MKPIIVTYSNESYIMNTGRLVKISMGYYNEVIPKGGLYFCEELITHNSASIYVSNIKLIARPK